MGLVPSRGAAGYAATIALLFLAACAGRPKPRPTLPPPPSVARPAPPSTSAKPTTAIEAGVRPGPAVTSLALTNESARAGMAAFRLSCPALVKRSDASGLARPEDWRAACADAMTRLDVDGPDFFARWFDTVVVGDGATFATGYYEPEIAGCRNRDDGCAVPIYRRPSDLVDAEFSANPGGPTGRKRRGRMEDGQLVPYYDRAEIENGALRGQGLEIAWARDPVEFFFLQIQGSGRLLLPDGSVMRIGYDGQNGREYVAVGRIMREQGLLGPNQLSMQGVMAGLRAQPDGGTQLMQADKSYVFFREIIGPGPLGALGVPVVGRASVAADPKFVPLGAPVFLTLDRAEASGLWVAQDTGGAIKGPNRFDTFWGGGAAARITAGGMSGRGRTLILLPKAAAERAVAAGGRSSAQR